MTAALEELRRPELDPTLWLATTAAGLATYAVLAMTQPAVALALFGMAAAAGSLVVLLAWALSTGSLRWFLTGIGSGVILVSGAVLLVGA